MKTRGRPQQLTPDRKQVSLYLSPRQFKRLEKARGQTPRAEYIRDRLFDVCGPA